MSRKVVGSMSEWSGMLKDLFRQIGDGSVNREQMRAFLDHRNPFEAQDSVSEWMKFYHEVFDIEVDLWDLQIPERQEGFDRLIIVAYGMTPQRLYDKCSELFLCWKWTDKNLDEIVESERTAQNGSYAIWIRERVEADEELKNLSADDLKNQNIPGITLPERLIYELKYFRETGKRLDVKNVTLCAGSRYSTGSVPRVDWRYGRLGVDWYPPDFAYDFLLRSRRVVS